MEIQIIKRNIANLESWLLEKPNDEDYSRLLEEYQEELKKYI